MELIFTLNGRETRAQEVPGELSLLELLRQRFGLLGTKQGCGVGECGACSVLLDGQVVNSCLTPAWRAHGRSVLTIEGLAGPQRPHPLQEAFVDAGAVQCGFCTPGMILAASDLLAREPDPDEDRIAEALAGNLCRCTGYHDIIRAVRHAARKMGGEES